MAIHVTHKSKQSLTVSAGAGFTVSSNGTTVGRRYMLSFVNYDAGGNLVSAVSNGEGVVWTLLTSKTVGAGSFSFFHGTCNSAGTGNWRASAGNADVVDYVLDEITGGVSAQSITNIIDLSAAIGSAAPTGNTQVIELGPLTNSESGTYEFWWNDDILALPYSISARSPTVTAMGHWITSGASVTAHILTTFTSAASSASVQVSAQTPNQLFRGFGFEIVGSINSLDVQSSEYGYEVGSPDLDQTHSINVQSSEYGYEAGSPFLGNLQVTPSEYGFEIQSVDIVQTHVISPASSEYGYESQSVEVLRLLVVQSLEMGYEIGSVELVKNLVITSSEYGIEIESVDIVQQHAMSPASSEYGYEAQSVDLDVQHNVSPGSSEYGTDIESADLIIQYTLAVTSSEYGFESQSATFRYFVHGKTPEGRRKQVPLQVRKMVVV